MSGDERPYRELSNRAIFWAAVVLIVVGVGLAVVLLVVFGSGEHSAQLDAIKTAGTIVVGTGGAAALWLAARRQRTSEIALNQKHADQQAAERAHALQERVAATGEVDAESRRITESYGRAVDQLGSDKAPVRLGGLYALRRLAQDNPGQRQTIVDVLCAYLRMPCDLPGEPPADDADELLVQRYQARSQEHQVRLTAQRLLTRHLKPDDETAFWSEIDLDLTGAVLAGFDLAECQVGRADFTAAKFHEGTEFRRARFTGLVLFRNAEFVGPVDFNGAQFEQATYFTEARFAGAVIFFHSRFEQAAFHDVKFEGTATFEYARFADRAGFNGARFYDAVAFTSTRFAVSAAFDEVAFHDAAFFDEAQFGVGSSFNVSVQQLDMGPEPQPCWVRSDFSKGPLYRSWPMGWSVVPTDEKPKGETEGEWGRLVRDQG